MNNPLNIFTLNCWGIPVISKNRKERIKAIANYLAKSDHNIVCLQEIWSEYDYMYLKNVLKTSLPFSHYFYSGVLGSGLCVFSKWIIQDVFFHQWSLNGYIHKIHHGDWFGGKGVGLCRIKCHEKLINVYCTHLHAEYDKDDIYLAHRVLQAYSTAEFVNLTKTPADISILAGDFNTGPGDLSFRLIKELASLVDPYDLNCECDDPTIRISSGTCDNVNNSYSDPKSSEVCPEGKRIDHILFHVEPNCAVEVKNFGNPLQDRVPDQPFSYSDHNAVTLQLCIKETKESSTAFTNNDSPYEAITHAILVCEEAKVTITSSKKLNLTGGLLLFMIIIGTVEFWPNYLLCDILRVIAGWLCIYCLVMGSLWFCIEMNCLKAGVSGLELCKASHADTKSS